MGILARSFRRKGGSNRGRPAVILLEPLEVRTLLTLTPIPATLNFTAAVPPAAPVTVGSFLDSDTTAVPADFTATIHWGNGNLSAGTVAGGDGRYTVSGSNLYLTPNTYPITVQVQDYLGNTATIDSTAYVAGPVLTPIGTALNFTAGIPPSGPVTIGSFFDANPGAAAGDFTATVRWDDGTISAGTVTASPTTPGLFLVQGTNLYTVPKTYAIAILVQDTAGNSTTISSTATVTANGPATLTGGLADVIINGPHAAQGFTNTDRPTFTGTTAPFAIVDLYARHFHVDAELPLGEAVASGNGQWTLTSGPLAVGTYIVTGTVTIPGGYPSGMITLHNQNGSDLVYIDLKPKVVRWLSHGQGPIPHTRVHAARAIRPRPQWRPHDRA